jgi:hypothetical protein
MMPVPGNDLRLFRALAQPKADKSRGASLFAANSLWLGNIDQL